MAPRHPLSASKDKSLGQATINKVHHRISRLKRDEGQIRASLKELDDEHKSVDAAIEKMTRALLSARDDENELVLRFVEAKLQNELLSDAKCTLDDDITQLRRDLYALEGDLRTKERLSSLLLNVEQQRKNEAETIRSFAESCAKQAKEVEDKNKEASRALHTVSSRIEAETMNLSAMEMRLESIKESVSNALNNASTLNVSRSISRDRGSPERRRQ